MSEVAAAPAPVAPRGPSFVDRIRTRFRDPNPILVKELLATFRTTLFIRFLYISTGLVAIVVLAGGAMVASGPMPPAEVGQAVFQIFFTTLLFGICWVAPPFAATTITSEKEARTYESLLLSGMDPWRIVRGKFLAAYASMMLVLLAIGPVVGIAFLFGGVSPTQVAIGFYITFLALAPAIAFGIALSARLGSTRIAILVAFCLSALVPFFLTGFLVAIGEGLRSGWGFSMIGPFWFTEALANGFLDPARLGLVLIVPTFFLGMMVWLCLASAMAGVRPAAEDRSTAFKAWTIVMTIGTLVSIAFAIGICPDGGTARDLAIGLCIVVGLIALGYGLVFMNEPPLPPRNVEQKRESYGIFRKLLTPFGPGAAPTLRFAATACAVLCIGASAVSLLALELLWKGSMTPERQADLAALGLGNACVAVWFATLGSWLRGVLGSGAAARLLSGAGAALFAVVPLVVTLVIDPNSLESGKVPLAAYFSPLLPAMLAGDDTTSPGVIIVTLGLYGPFAFAMWLALELRVRNVKKVVDARRAAAQERKRHSVPPPVARIRASSPDELVAAAEKVAPNSVRESTPPAEPGPQPVGLAPEPGDESSPPPPEARGPGGGSDPSQGGHE